MSGTLPFETKLFCMLDSGNSEMISWCQNGKSFEIPNMPTFLNDFLPKYFKDTSAKDFQRCLQKNKFKIATNAKYPATFTHPCFQQNRLDLLTRFQEYNAKQIWDQEDIQISSPEVHSANNKPQELLSSSQDPFDNYHEAIKNKNLNIINLKFCSTDEVSKQSKKRCHQHARILDPKCEEGSLLEYENDSGMSLLVGSKNDNNCTDGDVFNQSLSRKVPRVQFDLSPQTQMQQQNQQFYQDFSAVSYQYFNPSASHVGLSSQRATPKSFQKISSKFFSKKATSTAMSTYSEDSLESTSSNSSKSTNTSDRSFEEEISSSLLLLAHGITN